MNSCQTRTAHIRRQADRLATEAVRYSLCRALLATSFSQMPDICEAKTNAYGMEDGMKGATNWRIPPSGRNLNEQEDTMKRFKRNRIQRAFEKGYQLGLAGRPRENCPFLTGLARSKWLEGWREGRNDWREGLTDALTCYKLSGF